MISYILDTDTLSELQRGNNNVRGRLEEIDPDCVAVTIVTVVEQLIEGRYKQVHEAESRKPRNLPDAYRRFREAVEFFQRVKILDYTTEAHECYDKLRKAGITKQKVKPHDLRIGCIALDYGATLVTRNIRDFQHIPNLKIVDWTTET